MFHSYLNNKGFVPHSKRSSRKLYIEKNDNKSNSNQRERDYKDNIQHNTRYNNKRAQLKYPAEYINAPNETKLSL